MFHGKMKAITFSYDDGTLQDIRLIDILNRHGLKATFNLNSELLGQENKLERGGVIVDHTKVPAGRVKEIYQGHEVAVHTLTHPNLTETPDREIIRQVETDRQNLSALAGYEVVGMAYPGGGVNHNEHVADVISRHTGVAYARTILSSGDFSLPFDLHRISPTGFHLDLEGMHALADKFLLLSPDQPQLFYIWGHSFEFDIANSWNAFEEFCRKIAGKDDIFYGTNREVLL